MQLGGLGDKRGIRHSVPIHKRVIRSGSAGRRPPRPCLRRPPVSDLAPLLQGFFTDKLLRQRSPWPQRWPRPTATSPTGSTSTPSGCATARFRPWRAEPQRSSARSTGRCWRAARGLGDRRVQAVFRPPTRRLLGRAPRVHANPPTASRVGELEVHSGPCPCSTTCGRRSTGRQGEGPPPWCRWAAATSTRPGAPPRSAPAWSRSATTAWTAPPSRASSRPVWTRTSGWLPGSPWPMAT